MHIRLLTKDNWKAGVDSPVRVYEPTWEEIEQAIVNLNGNERTMTILTKIEEGDQYMIIAGRWEDRVMVNATANNLDFHSLVDDGQPKGSTMLCVGGQLGDYEQRKCVPLGWGIRAARMYFQTGELDPAMNWVSDY